MPGRGGLLYVAPLWGGLSKAWCIVCSKPSSVQAGCEDVEEEQRRKSRRGGADVGLVVEVVVAITSGATLLLTSVVDQGKDARLPSDQVDDRFVVLE